jgi:UDP-N-acetylmuramate dehydrogenase
VPHQLAEYTTLRLGGPAARVVEASDIEQLVATVKDADARGERVLVVGGGSNLVVGDAGWDGVVVLVRIRGIEARDDGNHMLVTASAGEPWDAFVARTVDEDWSGLAALSGIPGLTGATPIQNVGAYGGEVSDVIGQLRVLDRETGAVEDWAPERCSFGFRTSAFKFTDRYIVLAVTFRLRRSPIAPPARYAELARRLGVDPGDSAPSAEVRKVVLELRGSKGMVLDGDDPDTWSVGSFFVNPIVDPATVPDGCPNWPAPGGTKLSAAWLIENAGFGKGFGLDRGEGRVSVSTKHSLALTNRGGATTAELLDLARVIRDGVVGRFGIRLRPEAHLVGVEL